jgi:hypothetical protein
MSYTVDDPMLHEAIMSHMISLLSNLFILSSEESLNLHVASWQQYFVFSALDLLKPLQQFYECSKVQITQDKVMDSTCTGGYGWWNLGSWECFCQVLKYEECGIIRCQINPLAYTAGCETG